MNQRLAPPCWHCGQPAPSGAFIARTPEGKRDACCPGCAAAIETIYGMGLDDYYRIRQDDAPAPDARRAELDLALFDIADLLAPHSTRYRMASVCDCSLAGSPVPPAAG
ncbi:heavy metal translocating P-type ATPase metal-binding domain-containing protein [Alcanivorax sp.]|uniref:heavy metal translocating P-type ATPase metal-binding domain-containing protein n=1 Tax=Alcanivorax sp. TaxID=1872427 RepID=UPI003BAA11BF